MYASRNSNPYIGPAAFKEDQSHLFFGREREAKKLLSLVSSERLILFYSPSGAGKTSLLQARIVPALKKKKITVLPIARVGGDLPKKGLVPENVYVFNAVSYLARSEEITQKLDALARVSITEFLELELERNEKQSPFVVIFDQFEEIVTSHPEFRQQREQFFQQLKQAIAHTPYLSIILTMREDRIAGLDTYAPLLPDRLKTRFRMERLGVRSAVEAVCSPATAAGRPFAEGAAESLVDNLREERAPGDPKIILGEFVEPVQLQVTCFRLWESLANRPGAKITRRDLTSFGGVDEALETFYEETIGHVARESAQSEKVIRLWFQRELITPTLIRRQVNRGPEQAGGLSNEVVEELENHYLVRSETARGGVWYELVHDRLVDPILKSNRRVLHKRRKRVLASVILVALLTLVWLATSLARLSAEKKRIAIAVSLSQQAVELLESHRPRSLWLAREAARATYPDDRTLTFPTKNALHQALRGSKAKLVATIESGEVEEFYGLSFDLEGKKLATLRVDGQLAVWDVDARAGAPLFVITEPSVEAAALSGNGALVATSDPEAHISIWQVGSQVSHSTFKADDKPQDIHFSPDGESLVLIGELESISMWDIATRQKVLSADYSEEGVTDIAFHPRGKLLATASGLGSAGEIELWNLNNTSASQPSFGFSTGGLPAVAFNTDGSILASVGFPSTFEFWVYTASGAPWILSQRDAKEVELADPALDIALYPTGWGVLLVSHTGSVRSWDLAPNSETDILPGSDDRLTSAVFSPTGRRLAISKPEGITEVWEILLEDVSTVLDHGESVRAVAFSHDGLLLASVGGDLGTRVWEVKSGRTLWGSEGNEARVTSVEFSPNDELLATASNDGTLKIRESRTGELLRTSRGRGIAEIAFGCNGQVLLSADKYGVVRAWDVTDGNGEVILDIGQGQLEALALQPDENLFVASARNGPVTVWDLETGEKITSIEQELERITALEISSDGWFLAIASGNELSSAGEDPTIEIWDLQQERLRRTLSGHTGRVTGLAFSRDGDSLASCDVNGQLNITPLGPEARSIRIPGSSSLLGLDFSPDGSILATAGKDGSIRLEPLGDEELVRLADERVGLEPPLMSAQ